MAERRISRRGFIRAGLIAGAVVVGERIFRDVYSPTEVGPLTEKEIEKLVFVTEGKPSPVFEIQEGEIKRRVKPVPDIKHFYQEIIRIAQREDPQRGVAKVHSFLDAYPLEIHLSGENRRKVKISVDSGLGYYEPQLYEGPRIVLFKDFFREYYNAERAGRESDWQMAQCDRGVYHELIHLYQDMRGRYALVFNLAMRDVYMAANNISEVVSMHGSEAELLTKLFKNQNLMAMYKILFSNSLQGNSSLIQYLVNKFEEIEEEAHQKSEEILTELWAEKMWFDLQEVKERPYFGQFFSFDEVS